LYICVCECLLQNTNHKTNHKNNNISKQHSCVRGRRSIAGLPYYCAPLVCISAVIGLLAVWRHNKPKSKTFLVTVLGVCCLPLLRVYACVCCSISILFLYMYVHMPSSLRSIVGVLSSQALPGFPITAPPSVCVSNVIGALAVWIQNQQKKIVREIDCGNWLAREYMPAHQLCELFYPLAGDSQGRP